MDPRTISIRLDYPPKELQPNGRPHHMVKAKAKKAYKEACRIDALNVRNKRGAGETWPLTSPVTAQAEFHVKPGYRHDEDNLGASLKTAWDAIVAAGLLADDSDKHLTIVRPLVCTLEKKADTPYVLIFLREAPL